MAEQIYTTVMISRAKVSLQNWSKIQDIGCNISILGIAEGHLWFRKSTSRSVVDLAGDLG